MKDPLYTILCELEPPQDVYRVVLHRVVVIRRRRATADASLWIATCIVSGVLFVLVCIEMSQFGPDTTAALAALTSGVLTAYTGKRSVDMLRNARRTWN